MIAIYASLKALSPVPASKSPAAISTTSNVSPSASKSVGPNPEYPSIFVSVPSANNG